MLGGMQMHTDAEACLRAVRTRDARFDGWFYTGVTSTGIYCRPSCPAMTPRPEHLRFYPTAAAAQAAGFRACKRCRPDATPGSPEWHVREDVVARAMRLIADGVVDAEGVEGLARRLGYSTRHLERLVRAELGAGPLALARAQRAQAARTLIETTRLPLADVAFAAGFASIRSFNETVRAVFATTPSELRRRAGTRRHAPGAQELRLRLPFRHPLHVPSLFGHLAATAVPGVEVWDGTAFERSLRLPHGAGTVRLRPGTDHVEALLRLTDLRDLTTAINRCRALLDLDADPAGVDEQLAADPVLAPLVRRAPGCRIPGTVDPEEMALRVVLGQQVSTRAAATTTARLARAVGDPLPDSLVRPGGPTHLFPSAEAVAGLAEDDGRLPGMPAAAARCCTWPVRSPRARWTSAPGPAGPRPGPPSPACPASGPGPPRSSRCGRCATRTPSPPATWASSGPRRPWDCRPGRASWSGTPAPGGRGAPTPPSCSGPAVTTRSPGCPVPPVPGSPPTRPTPNPTP